MSWLNDHLNAFVKPIVGYIPTLPKDYASLFTPNELSIIKSQWRAVKCAAKQVGKPILLAGRDVFVYEILARRENYPTTFRPDISRLTAEHVKEDYSGHFLFDTGFAGSIARDLKITQYTMGSSSEVLSFFSNGSCNCLACRRKRGIQPLVKDVHQVFPRMKGSRSLALKIEWTPKYWKRGYTRQERGLLSDNNWADWTHNIHQDLSPLSEFIKAALLTIEVYTSNAPKFVEQVVITNPMESFLD